MSLATRCTACGTIFRVVQDQLRVSDGWVRCGRCAEVFDAREQLFDMDREPPPVWPAPGLPSASSLAEPQAMASEAAAIEAEPEVIVVAPAPAYEPAYQPEHEPEFAPAVPAPAAPPPDQPAASPPAAHIEPHFDEPLVAQEPHEPIEPPSIELDPQPDVVLAPRLAELAADPADAPSPAVAEKTATPEFVRRAQAQQRWQRPGVRVALGLACGLLLGLLAGQFAWQFRDALAAQYPEAAPTLNAACEALGCKVQPWRHIEAISVEQTALSQAGSGNHYKLALTLRNKSVHELALPWVDLSLTDASGQLVARRMLSPADFNLKTDRLSPHAEQPLQLVFGSGSQRVAGYTVEIFHP
ncbi:zinc-ribbon and DUF3426 domain-containing protein [Pelomonas sp. V22]|uniref:zinc-ribbon and DUF3426 domain-containing protein n=1 Tax=Pelomonas sp. V22 TaxID=2822139 RepID=UPI0024A7CB53|nr:zinc-ribbon and DUF3426 domain-containing protein [Pelomonas sp. V22]MDI4632620.1 zinc-ribbon and DUF3426 domain-containing protein [Pelomonas sp. V22]